MQFKELIHTLIKFLNDKKYDEIPTLLSHYKSNRIEWSSFAIQDYNNDTQYTRNRIFYHPEIGEILLIIWKEGRKSPMHDHKGSNCYVKIIYGQIKENIETIENIENEKKFTTNQISFINDSIGRHQMSNLNNDDISVSLHVYSGYIGGIIYKDFTYKFI
jgi:cysteine dioxygenase